MKIKHCLLFSLIFISNIIIGQTVYTSIQDGNYRNNNTWSIDGGTTACSCQPPTSINTGDSIVIQHDVFISGRDLDIIIGSVTIDNGVFTTNNRPVFVAAGQQFIAINSLVDIGDDFINAGTFTNELSCIEVDGTYQNQANSFLNGHGALTTTGDIIHDASAYWSPSMFWCAGGFSNAPAAYEDCAMTAEICNGPAYDADLSVNLTAPNQACQYGNIFFFIDIDNNGPDTAYGVFIENFIPAGVTLFEYTIDAGATWIPWVGDFFIDKMANGDVVNLIVHGIVNAATTPAIVENTVTIGTASSDSNLSDNSDNASSVIPLFIDDDGDNVAAECDLDDDNDGIPDIVENSITVLEPIPSCETDPIFDFSSLPTLIAGVDRQEGAVYRFSNVRAGIDALVTIEDLVNLTIPLLDDNGTNPMWFNPQSAATIADSGNYAYQQYLFQFVTSGTATAINIPASNLTFNDVDGNTQYGEQSWAQTPTSYTADNPTDLSFEYNEYVVGTADTLEYPSVTGNFPQVNYYVRYENKSQFRVRFGVIARSDNVSTAGRQHSLSFTCPGNFVNPYTVSADKDRDGIPNYLDLDSDNDGLLDAYEAGHGLPVGADGRISGASAGSGFNGLFDGVETSPDSDTIAYTVSDSETLQDTIYDAYELDSDADGCYDSTEESVSDTDNDGIAGTGVASVDSNGLVSSITYSTPPNNEWQDPSIFECAPPFVCNSNIYIASSSGAANPSQLSIVDISSSPYTLNPIGPGSGSNYNALGYREQDDFLYGIKLQTNELIRIDSNGIEFNLGPITGLPVPASINDSYDSGDVFPDGDLYIHEVNSHSEMYQINVVSTPPSLVQTHNLDQSIWLSDFAYNSVDDKVYGIGDAGDKYMIDPVTWTVSTIGANAPAASYGAAYTNDEGHVFVYRNNPGALFFVDFGLNGTGTGNMTLLSSAPNVSFNDGASCRGSFVIPEICGNGIDNDGDGLIDCFDSDCYLAINSGENDHDGDGIGDSCDLDDDNDGILDTDEGYLCTSLDLSSYAGTISTIEQFNALQVNLSGAIIQIEDPLTFGGTATIDEFGVNDNHETGSYGLQLGVNSSSTSDYLEARYSFSRDVCNFNARILDIDVSDALEIYGYHDGVEVPYTIHTIGSCVAYDLLNTFNSSCLANSSPANGNVTEHAIDIEFDYCIDSIRIRSFENGVGSGGSYTFVLSPDPTCVAIDTDNDGIANMLDLDSDNDGILDIEEAGHSAIDANNDGIIDGLPAAFGINGLYNGVETSADSDVINYDISDSELSPDGTYDAYELDSDGDGCVDALEEGIVDVDGDGIAGTQTGAPVVDPDGLVTTITYADPINNNWQNPFVADCLPEICAYPFLAGTYNVWHTGSGGGLDFNQPQTSGPFSGYPSTFVDLGTPSNMPKREGGATFCDPRTGEVIIYSDGERAWNQNGVEYTTSDAMNRFNTASTNLFSAAGTPLIVPAPGQCNANEELYIFFTDDHLGATPELYYVIVDVPNQSIGNPIQLTNYDMSEQINAVQVNCDSTWIVYRNELDMEAILWTTSGFAAPVVTANIHGDTDQRYSAAFSLDGSRFATSLGWNPFDSPTELMVASFNSGTGQFFNALYLNPFNLLPVGETPQGNYDVNFSPDGSKLYCTITSRPSLNDYLIQFDLAAGTAVDIQNSAVTIAVVSDTNNGFGGMMSGPDGRLYLSSGDGANDGENFIHVIDFPNLSGALCGFHEAFLVPGGDVTAGLNNMVYGKGPISCIPLITVSPGGNLCEEMILTVQDCYQGDGGPYDVVYYNDGIRDTLFNQALNIDSEILITGLAGGMYDSIQVLDGNSCGSNFASFYLQGAPNLTNSIGPCIDHPLEDIAQLEVEVSWVTPLNDTLEVSVLGSSHIIMMDTATSPTTVLFNVPADGSTDNIITASWGYYNSGCAEVDTFDSPIACSNDSIACNILYFCGDEKPSDGDAWDHGWIEYLDNNNGTSIVDAIYTVDEPGQGTYDPMNPATFINIDYSNYDLIIVSATTEDHISSDLIDVLKNLKQSVILSNYLEVQAFDLSNSAGFYNFDEDLYVDNSNSEQIYDYNNSIDPLFSNVFTHLDYRSDATAYLWNASGAQAAENQGVYVHYESSDIFPNIASHGPRTYFGFHMNELYANQRNGGPVPTPVDYWFHPAKDLTTLGKLYFDQMIIEAASQCGINCQIATMNPHIMYYRPSR